MLYNIKIGKNASTRFEIIKIDIDIKKIEKTTTRLIKIFLINIICKLLTFIYFKNINNDCVYLQLSK